MNKREFYGPQEHSDLTIPAQWPGRANDRSFPVDGFGNIDTALLRSPFAVKDIVFEGDLGTVTGYVEDFLSLLI